MICNGNAAAVCYCQLNLTYNEAAGHIAVVDFQTTHICRLVWLLIHWLPVKLRRILCFIFFCFCSNQTTQKNDYEKYNTKYNPWSMTGGSVGLQHTWRFMEKLKVKRKITTGKIHWRTTMFPHQKYRTYSYSIIYIYIYIYVNIYIYM
jgi:hypothetical protein